MWTTETENNSAEWGVRDAIACYGLYFHRFIDIKLKVYSGELGP